VQLVMRYCARRYIKRRKRLFDRRRDERYVRCAYTFGTKFVIRCSVLTVRQIDYGYCERQQPDALHQRDTDPRARQHRVVYQLECHQYCRFLHAHGDRCQHLLLGKRVCVCPCHTDRSAHSAKHLYAVL
jgi:hypothetical protein